jgi:penicillin-binding protein 2
VSLREALARSCDVYFYTLGQRLGIERIARYARQFGLGRPTGIEIEGEKPGLVPDPAWSLARRQHPWYAGETISVAIGQGPILVTPLQLASMAAVIANGGQPIVPHLVRGEATQPPPHMTIGARELELVRQAMWAVVNDGGTGGGVRIPGLEIAGKTGTVQVSAQGAEEGAENLPYELRNHAWFASFAPVGAPRLVVVVFVEHGGHGSSAAGPIAKALYERFFQVDDRGLHTS